MITFEDYERGLKVLADDIVANQRDPVKHLEALLKGQNAATIELFEFRKYYLDAHDRDRIAPYLEFGYYTGQSEDDRVVFFCLEFELEAVARRTRLVNFCKAYDDGQTAFTLEPRLTDHIRVKGSRKGGPENEMVKYAELQQIHDSEVMMFDKSFVKLVPALNPRIPEWISTTFPRAPLFVRIDPDIASRNQLPQLLTEELKVNPYAYAPAEFELNHNMVRGEEYSLFEVSPTPETLQEWWDYKVRGVRSLQTSSNGKGTYRSFMIEELDDKLGGDEILIGRCIHLDSKNFRSTEIGDQSLDHLDLAVNVYEGANRKTRLGESLRNGKITDADYRTHVLRVEQVPLCVLPMMCLLFLASPTLTQRYHQDIGDGSIQKRS